MTTPPIRYTLDASVIMNAFNPAEAGHAISLQLQTAIQSQAILVIVPTLLLTEVAATISRIRLPELLPLVEPAIAAQAQASFPDAPALQAVVLRWYLLGWTLPQPT